MNKRKFFTILAVIVLPIVLLAALLSTSNDFFKGSILEDLGLETEFAVTLTNPGLDSVISSEDLEIINSPLFVDTSNNEPYYFNFITNEDRGVSYQISLFSFSEEIDFDRPDLNLETLVADLDPEQAFSGSLTNVELIKDSTGNVLESITGFKKLRNPDELSTTVWNKQCRYDRDWIKEASLNFSFTPTEFSACDTSLNHYITFSAQHDREVRTILFPIQFTNTQNLTWTLPNDEQPRFLEGSAKAVNKNYTQINSEDDSAADFTFSSSQDYKYSVELVSVNSPEEIMSELTQLNTVDLVSREILPETDTTSGESTFTWDKTCSNVAGESIACTEADALSENAIKINVTIEEQTKSYYFPLVQEHTTDRQPSAYILYPEKAINPLDHFETRTEDNFQFSNYTSLPIQIDRLLEGETVPFSILGYQPYQFTYDFRLVQTSDTPAEIGEALFTDTALENLVTLESSDEPTSGLNSFNWDGQCLDEALDDEYCNNNYILISLENSNSDPAQVHHYLFPLKFAEEIRFNAYWLEFRPFKNSGFTDDDDDIYENSEPLAVNLEKDEDIQFAFNTNQTNANYTAKIYYNRPGGGEVTVAQLATDLTTGEAFEATTFTWDKTCRLEDGSDSTSERCVQLLDDDLEIKFRTTIQKDFNEDGDFDDTAPINETLTYNSDISFVRFIEPEWKAPVEATNENFLGFTVNITDFGEDVKGFKYPSDVYVDLSEDVEDITFTVTAAESTFESTAKLVFANDIEEAYAERNRDMLTERELTEITTREDTESFTWDRVCDDVLDCISPEIADMQKAIEFTLTSTEDGVLANNVYIFPISFDTPDRPTIDITAPIDGSSEAPDQDFITLEVRTGEAAICKANLDEADFDFDAAGNIALTPNTDKTVHTTEEITDLPNNSSQTIHVKCAVESIPSIRNYARTQFNIGRDTARIDWIAPDYQNSDFTDTSADAGKPFVAVYNDNLTVNSESAGNLSLKFKPINKEITYSTHLLTSATEIDFDDILDDPATEITSLIPSIVDLSNITGNTDSNYTKINVDPGEESTIRWDKQCVNSDEEDKPCSTEEYYSLIIQVTDQETGEISYYFFPLEVSDEASIESCRITGDELVFNPTIEGLLFSFETPSENISEFDYTIKILNSSEREIAEILDANNESNGTGSFAWEGEIGSSRTISDGNYTAVFNITDNDSDLSCEDTWNFLVDNSEPFTNAEFEILLDEDEFRVPDETVKVTLNQNKDSFRTVVNAYKKGSSKATATIYACVAGEDTDDEDEACPDDISFEWDGSHTFNYLPEGKYFLRGSILDSSGLTTASISEDFEIEHGNIRNSASGGACSDYFIDISSNDPLCDAVVFAREAEIFLGTNGRIEHTRPLTRAEFIVVTNRIKDQVNPSTFNRIQPYSQQYNGDMGHPDLTQYVGNPNARWFMEEIWRAKQAGLVKGNADGTMRPLNLITGPEAFKLVQLATEVNSSTEDANPWYADYTEFNYRYGIDTAGVNEFTTAVTRGQLMYYIHQLNRAGLYTP